MDNPFLDGWNPSLDQAEKEMGETFVVNGTPYSAVAIEPLSYEQNVTKGGRFPNSALTLVVRRAIMTASGLAVGSLLTARGQQLRVKETDNDGDDSILLICSPAGVEFPR